MVHQSRVHDVFLHSDPQSELVLIAELVQVSKIRVAHDLVAIMSEGKEER